jgi:hypothetical protein
MKNISEKHVEEITTHILSSTVLFKIRGVYEICGKIW